jgi:hypothetical protein
VLGSRIRTTDITGPSPVAAYDRDFIEATGAMTLSDFLNKIPQAYSGIASGRASAPDEFNPISASGRKPSRRRSTSSWAPPTRPRPRPA